MSYYIIIRGPLGIGKSTIAKKLAERLNGEHIPIDKVLEKHDLDKVDKDVECIPAENFIKANGIILPKAREKLGKGKILVFDACFYHKEPPEHILNRLSDYRHYIFTLKAPLKVCIERDSKRKKTHGKDAAKAVHKLVSRFDYGMIINTEGKTADETAKEIQKII